MGERKGGGEGGLRKRKGKKNYCLQRSRCVHVCCVKMRGGAENERVVCQILEFENWRRGIIQHLGSS